MLILAGQYWRWRFDCIICYSYVCDCVCLLPKLIVDAGASAVTGMHGNPRNPTTAYPHASRPMADRTTALNTATPPQPAVTAASTPVTSSQAQSTILCHGASPTLSSHQLRVVPQASTQQGTPSQLLGERNCMQTTSGFASMSHEPQHSALIMPQDQSGFVLRVESPTPAVQDPGAAAHANELVGNEMGFPVGVPSSPPVSRKTALLSNLGDTSMQQSTTEAIEMSDGTNDNEVQPDLLREALRLLEKVQNSGMWSGNIQATFQGRGYCFDCSTTTHLKNREVIAHGVDAWPLCT